MVDAGECDNISVKDCEVLEGDHILPKQVTGGFLERVSYGSFEIEVGKGNNRIGCLDVLRKGLCEGEEIGEVNTTIAVEIKWCLGGTKGLGEGNEVEKINTTTLIEVGIVLCDNRREEHGEE